MLFTWGGGEHQHRALGLVMPRGTNPKRRLRRLALTSCSAGDKVSDSREYIDAITPRALLRESRRVQQDKGQKIDRDCNRASLRQGSVSLECRNIPEAATMHPRT